LRLAIVRSASRLTSVHSRRCAAFVPPGGRGSSVLASLFDVDKIPLPGPRLPTALVKVAEAWERLSDAGAHSAGVLADALLVLVSTVPSAANDAVPALQIGTRPSPPRPTAAHPRAFRGTKSKPPRTSEPTRRDLRPLLCAPVSTRSLLTPLWHSRASSLNRLRQLGLGERGLARLAQCASPPPDPYLVFHHDDVPSRPLLPPEFVEHLLPSLSGAPWERVRRAAALHQRLGLVGDEQLSLLAARLQQGSHQHGLTWLEALETQPPERRVSFLVLVLESGVARNDARLSEALAADLALAPIEVYERWVYVTLDALRRGVSPRYLAAGVHFALQYAPDAGFYKVSDAPDFKESTGQRLEDLLPGDWAGQELMSLWEACAALPGFSAYVEETDWSTFTEAQRRYLLRFFMLMRWDQDGVFEPERWRAIAACLPRLEQRVREVHAAYTDQYLNDIGALLSDMKRTADIRERFPLAIDLLARVNRPPFDPDGDAARSLSNLLKLRDPHRGRVLAAADATFLTLDKACRRSNAATLIAWGLSSLVDGIPDLVSETFVTAIGPLIRTARHLGVLSWAARAQLVGRCARLPIFERTLVKRALPEIVSTIRSTGVAEAAAVVPRALADHLAGRRQLSSAQIGRHLEKMRRALPACRLAVLRSAVDAQLSRAVGSLQVDREAMAALALLQDAEKNRRGLRRFLRALLNGDTDHLVRHPATQGWARRHPRIDLSLWTRGLEVRVDAEDDRQVVIRLEQDSLEVLKMGTYVGSCLGLGGGLSYSAAAALLDVNKQVLYARDQHGSVIARQLVAISDNDQLVPFSVYPQSTPSWLQLAFDRYDTRLAAALGISRIDPNQAYDIENVLSHDWWDDGAWDPRALRDAAMREAIPGG
jgi:hypothetical protein